MAHDDHGRKTRAELDAITDQIIGASIKIHRTLGPGLLESCYEACLQFELVRRGLFVERQKPQPVRYEGLLIDVGFRLDLLVEREVIVELKALASILPIHECQILTYLKLSGLQLGLLINFNEERVVNGVHRFVNGLEDRARRPIGPASFEDR